MTIEGRAASLAYNRRHEELIKVVAEGKIPKLEELITRKITFDDFVEKGIKALINEKDTQSKSPNAFNAEQRPKETANLRRVQSRSLFIPRAPRRAHT